MLRLLPEYANHYQLESVLTDQSADQLTERLKHLAIASV
jgi:hypothetical protein